MMDMKRRGPCGQRGEGKVGAIIALLVVVLVIHVGMKFIPFKVQTAEFEGHIEEELLSLAANLRKPDDFILSVVEKASALELDLREDHLDLKLNGMTWEFKTQYEVTLKMIWGDWVQTVEIKRSRTKL